MGRTRLALVGGSGFVGTGLAHHLLASGAGVHIIDQHPPRPEVLAAGATAGTADLLLDPSAGLLAGVADDAHVVVLAGDSDARPAQPWVLGVGNVATALRLAPALAGRRVTLVSTVQVSGHPDGPGDLRAELPWDDDALLAWTARMGAGPDTPCRPHDVARACRELLEPDTVGTWTYALTKRAQELVFAAHVEATSLTVLRLANVVGAGQERVVNRFVRRALAGQPIEVAEPSFRSFLHAGHLARALVAGCGPGALDLGSEPVSMRDLATLVIDHLHSTSEIVGRPVPPEAAAPIDRDASVRRGVAVPPVAEWLPATIDGLVESRETLFHPPLPVVVPPRPTRPDELIERQQAALWSGEVKHGNRWTSILESTLTHELDLGPGRRLVATTSGTDALRVGIGATVGLATGGGVALLPSFTFPATGEVLVQLGYRLRFVDVDDETWTLDPTALDRALAAEPRAALVLGVDTFGHPCDYPALQAVCARHRVPLLADSAAALGSSLDGRPIADQALVHCYSMSFAKVLSAGGAGGAVVLPDGAALDDHHGWGRSALMTELHAAVALDQLANLHGMIARRREAARRYTDACRAAGLGHQHVRPGAGHTWVHFVVRVPGGAAVRDRLAVELARLGIGTRAYFFPLHRMSFGDLAGARREPLPVTERLGDEVLALPLSSELSEEQVERVVAGLNRAWTDLVGPLPPPPAGSTRSNVATQPR